MDDLSFSEKALAEKTVCVVLVRGESLEGAPIWAYVGVQADKLEDFLKAQNSGEFDPADFGVIIDQGEGEPSEEVRAKMESEYGFNHEKMVDMPEPGMAKEMISSINNAINESED